MKIMAFSNSEPKSANDLVQGKLLILAALVIITYALILTFAPAVRYHSGPQQYQYSHWLGVLIWFFSFSVLHRTTRRKLHNRDPLILPIIALLCGIGLLSIWRLYPIFGQRQAIWLAISSSLLFLGIVFPTFINYLRRYKYIWLLIGLLLTGLTILMGTNPSGAGPTRWLQLFGLHFQPSEPLKLILVIYLAGFFSDHHSLIEGKIKSLLPTLVIIGIAVLILVFQRDLGTAVILLLIYLALVFTSQGNRFFLWISPLLMIITGYLGYQFLDLVKVRFDTWLNPFGDPTGASYQIIQSMIAIASGGLFGAGPGLGSPTLIPVSVSDFIYAAIAEELGFLGVTVILLLFCLLIYRGIKLAGRTKNAFYRNLILGLIFYLGIQSILIIGGNIGLLPLTGVTLPFISYGGSSLIVSFCAALVLLVISDWVSSEGFSQPITHTRSIIVSGMMIPAIVVLIIVTSLHSFWYAPALVGRNDNPRWIIHDRFVKRGSILDRNSQVIVFSEGERGSLVRNNTTTPLYTTIGYTNPIYGQSGIETTMYRYLRGYEGTSFHTRFWYDLLYNQPPEGVNIRLTIDLTLQNTADSLLEGKQGAVILMNTNSGEILTMASHPYYDGAALEENWEALINHPDSPLVNRATQGLYPPGSSLFPFVASSYIDQFGELPEIETFLEKIPDRLNCAQPLFDNINWSSILTNGCINGQIILGDELGSDQLHDLYEGIGFYNAPQLHLNVAEGLISTNIETEDLLTGLSSFRISPYKCL
jgi:cell division protein FtsW (lipid II flippase)